MGCNSAKVFWLCEASSGGWYGNCMHPAKKPVNQAGCSGEWWKCNAQGNTYIISASVIRRLLSSASSKHQGVVCRRKMYVIKGRRLEVTKARRPFVGVTLMLAISQPGLSRRNEAERGRVVTSKIRRNSMRRRRGAWRVIQAVQWRLRNAI